MWLGYDVCILLSSRGRTASGTAQKKATSIWRAFVCDRATLHTEKFTWDLPTRDILAWGLKFPGLRYITGFLPNAITPKFTTTEGLKKDRRDPIKSLASDISLKATRSGNSAGNVLVLLPNPQAPDLRPKAFSIHHNHPHR